MSLEKILRNLERKDRREARGLTPAPRVPHHATEYPTDAPLTWEAIKDAYDYRCAYCDCAPPLPLLTKDHVVATGRGGIRNLHNVVPACKRCNGRKGHNYWTPNPPRFPDLLTIDALRQRLKDLNAEHARDSESVYVAGLMERLALSPVACSCGCMWGPCGKAT